MDIPLSHRSRQFAVGSFQHRTQTSDVPTCARQAEIARAAAAAALPDRLAFIATAAWWGAVADRCRDNAM